MSRERWERGSSLWVSVVGLLIAIAVLASLCALALITEGEATKLSRAVNRAESAAAIFYASSSIDQLAQRLEGEKAKENTIRCDNMEISLASKDEFVVAEISVWQGEELIYTLSCQKYAGERMP